METTLHRQLKQLYAADDSQFEVRLGAYRIDVVAGGVLVEIQHGPLSHIRDKVRRLLEHHSVLVVKPIVARKLLVKRAGKGKRVVQRRMSPKRGQVLDLFHDLIHFTSVFPHPRLTLDVPLVEVEEWRYPGHGRRRRWGRADFQVEDQKLVEVGERHRFSTAEDLCALIAGPLPSPFHTGHLAESLGVARWVAQRIAYSLSKMGGLRQVGKAGNAWLYEFCAPARAASA